MARQRMVTRTISVTKCVTMIYDKETRELGVIDYALTGRTYTKEEALKKLSKMYDNDKTKVIDITEITNEEVLMGMTELEFIDVARILPPRNGSDDYYYEEEDTEE